MLLGWAHFGLLKVAFIAPREGRRWELDRRSCQSMLDSHSASFTRSDEGYLGCGFAASLPTR